MNITKYIAVLVEPTPGIFIVQGITGVHKPDGCVATLTKSGTVLVIDKNQTEQNMRLRGLADAARSAAK